MEHYKRSKLLNNSTVSKFMTNKKMDWNIWFESNGQYSVNKNIRFKTLMLRSDLCDYGNAYIVVKWRVTVEGDSDDKTRNEKLIFKNNPLFRWSISKINKTYIDNAEDLDIVMPMYNLLEYSGNYSMTSGNFWHYYGDK